VTFLSFIVTSDLAVKSSLIVRVFPVIITDEGMIIVIAIY